MIFYRPTDGEVQTRKVDYRPKTCFIMTQLGNPIPENIQQIRESLTKIFEHHQINVLDANSVVTGRDFLIKIWQILLSVPLGIVIIDNQMSSQTFANIFYEVGLMQAYGKETLIVKTKGTNIPSDFVRTEYIEFNADFDDRLNMFVESFLELAEHYEMMAEQMENNPLLAIDYLRRAYLISGEENLREKVQQIVQEAGLEGRAKNSVEMLLANF